MVSFGQGNLEALIKSSQIWAAGVQDLRQEFAATAQAQLDQTMTTWKALAGVKSLEGSDRAAVQPGPQLGRKRGGRNRQADRCVDEAGRAGDRADHGARQRWPWRSSAARPPALMCRQHAAAEPWLDDRGPGYLPGLFVRGVCSFPPRPDLRAPANAGLIPPRQKPVMTFRYGGLSTGGRKMRCFPGGPVSDMVVLPDGRVPRERCRQWHGPLGRGPTDEKRLQTMSDGDKREDAAKDAGEPMGGRHAQHRRRRQGAAENPQARDVQSADAERRLHADGVRRARAGALFPETREEATRIMLHVHRRGVGVCGVFTYEVAETKVTQVMDLARQNQHPLQCTIEKE